MPRISIPFRVPPAAAIIAVVFGIGAGLGGYAFIYGRGFAYLTNDPRACVQCHVMQDQYSGWMRSTHHTATTCNSCHAPTQFVGKYVTKAINGFNHSLAFTTGNFEQPIRIKHWNLKIANNNCIECHQSLWNSPRNAHPALKESVSCTHCHKQVGHPH